MVDTLYGDGQLIRNIHTDLSPWNRIGGGSHSNDLVKKFGVHFQKITSMKQYVRNFIIYCLPSAIAKTTLTIIEISSHSFNDLI